MASILESQKAFESRALEVGMPRALLDELIVQGVLNMATFAFTTSYNSASGDDKPLKDLVKQLKGGVDGNLQEVAAFRRLAFEAQTLVTADARQSIERSEEDKPRKVPHVEREARLKALEAKLVGLKFTAELEVSNGLIDLCSAIAQEGVIRWVTPDLCTKRAQEIVGIKKDGSLKPEGDLQADTSDLLKLKYALQRRGLAFEATYLMSFDVHQAWIERLFDIISRDAIEGYEKVNVPQLMRADREWFIEIARRTRGGFKIDLLNGTFVLDAHATACMDAHMVTHLLSPMPKHGSSKATSSTGSTDGQGSGGPIIPVIKKKKRGKGKGGKGTGKPGNTVPMPAGLENCSRRTKNGNPICYNYNLPVGCKDEVSNNRCRRGLHVCAKCFANHSYQSHPATA
jgi:hypothetical protein